MKGSTKFVEAKQSRFALSVLKGSLFALGFSLVSILIFAFLLKFSSISDAFITPVNQVIKGLSIFFGVFMGFRKERKMGLAGGLLIGLIFTVLAFVSFSLLNGSFNFGKTLLTDSVFASIIGGICGIICVNIKKS